MRYNIDFEIMGMLVTIVIAIAFRMNYVSRTRSDKAFMKLIYFILASQALDMITAITFSLQRPELNGINLVMTTGYFYCAFATAVAFERYVASYLTGVPRNKFYDAFRVTLVVTYCIHGLLNPFTKLAFYFRPDGSYVHGDLYYVGYILPGVFEMAALYLIIRYRKHFSKKQWVSSVAFLVVVAVTMVLQAFFFSDIYLTFGVVPVALLMILHSLETPDYRKLTKTLEELEKARQEAWRANRVKSDFLANMSHEIRTPINAVLGFDEMILRESREEEVLSYAKNIKSSGQALLALVNDILDLSKIEAGKMEIVTAEYDVAESISGLLKMITPRAAEKGLRLICQVDERIPRRLVGDVVRIEQVLTNLLTNAVKYTNQGEVNLEIRLEKENAENVTIYYAVKDTGIGIRAEDQEKLFSEFGRVEGEQTHHVEGTGLGLPISMKCLTLMGSTLDVESVYGSGSTFSFRLEQKIADQSPIGDFEQAVNEKKKEVTVFQEDFTAPDARILVVDDVDLNLKVFVGLLKKSMMQIQTATSGMEAIRLIRENTYDCIFMDHQMPEMDGIETLERLKQDPEIKIDQVPVIALTANAIAGAKETYLEKGFSDYLSKPIDGWELLNLLHKWLPKDKIREADQEPEDIPEVLEFFPEEDEVTAGTKGTTEKEGRYDLFDRLKKAGIQAETGLEYAMNDEAFYLELLRDYAAGAKATSMELKACFTQGDWKNYEVKVHALKSTSKMVGAMEISEKAKRLEDAAREKREDVLLKEADGFLEQYVNTAETICKVMGMN